jgi:hypothetical protein
LVDCCCIVAALKKKPQRCTISIAIVKPQGILATAWRRSSHVSQAFNDRKVDTNAQIHAACYVGR